MCEIEAIFTERDIIVCVIATTAKQLGPSRVVPQWASSNCNCDLVCHFPPLIICGKTQGHEVPPLGTRLPWGWTTLPLIHFCNSTATSHEVPSVIRWTFMKIIVVNKYRDLFICYSWVHSIGKWNGMSQDSRPKGLCVCVRVHVLCMCVCTRVWHVCVDVHMWWWWWLW